MNELLQFHKEFYTSSKKSCQDALILKYCQAKQVKRRRSNQNKRSRKDFTIQYRILNDKKEFVPVCQKFFLSALKVTRNRVEYFMKLFYYTGRVGTETRGGNRKENLFRERKNLVRQFLFKLKCTESHYCRSSTQERKYLPSDLSINKLYKMFKIEHPQSSVKKSYFRQIFNKDFNLGFGSPRTDACSKCIELEERIKKEKDQEKKNNLIIEKRVHKLRAKAFFKLLQEKADGMITFSFDCQKNNPLPRVPDQSAYYARQLYLYNFTIVKGSSKDPLNKDTSFAYVWTENEFPKTANQIASALYDRLNKTNLDGITTVRLVADGCGGQNKNSILLCMLTRWLLDNPCVKKVEIIFPVTGHSFMPPDRVFGNIEKTLKKKEVIIRPEDYIDIIATNATITNMTEIQMLDFKTVAKDVLKPTAKWPFKITECKRFILKRSKIPGNVLIRGEPHFNSDVGTSVNVCKPRMKTNMIQPSVVPVGASMKRAKIVDVEALLKKHFGDEWQTNEECVFYLNIINSPHLEDGEEGNDENYCDEGLGDIVDLRI